MRRQVPPFHCNKVPASKATVLFTVLLFISVSVYSQAVWKQYNGPFAGEIVSFARLNNSIYAGTYLSGLFESRDDGKTWTHILPQWNYVHGLFATDTALVIGSDQFATYNPKNGKLTPLGQKLRSPVYYMLNHKGKLLMSTGDGIYVYNSTKKTFEQKSNGLPPQTDGWIATRQITEIGDALFCNLIGGDQAGLYKSIDAAEHWTKVVTPPYEYAFLFVGSSSDSLISAAGNNLYLSRNNGSTWTDIEFDLPYYPSVLDIASAHNTTFTSTRKGVFKLKNGETSWKKVSDKTFFEINYDGTVLIGSDKSGIYVWNESKQTFDYSGTGINTSRVTGIELFDHKLYSGTEGGLHFTATDGDSWNVVPELNDMFIMSLGRHGSMLFAGTGYGLYTTVEGSSNWSLSESSLPATGIWDIESAGEKLFVGTEDGVYKSVNDGKSWKRLSNSHTAYPQITLLGVSDSILIAGNNFGLYKIRPDSSDWDVVPLFSGQTIVSINVIDKDIYVAGQNSSLYRSSDYCKTWSVVDMPTIGKVDMIKRGDNIYASDYGKIFYSSDNGVRWNYFYETGFPTVAITCITEGDSNFYAGTYGTSIWKRPYLSDNKIKSFFYEIEDTVLYAVPGTELSAFKANVRLDYGASLEVIKSGPSSGRVNGVPTTIDVDDHIRIIAEDGKSVRTLRIAAGELITAATEAETVKLEVYPIPTSDYLQVKAPLAFHSYTITSILGEKMVEAALDGNAIDVSSLNKGFYLLIFEDQNNRKQVVKFVKE